MDHYSAERQILEAHRSMARTAEDRARLVPGLTRPSFRPWMATRLRGLADRLDGRPAAAHLRLVP
ncbi:MAG TPA: hypothetical protein VFR33_07050 [Candidatus Dormibacteraeota bacterium]|nr:hypothetical protein [Candidatus Dormibacteraeota bacterium]